MPTSKKRPDETGISTNFLTSRKNLVGLGAAAAAVVLGHLTFGLGALWGVAALAAWGAGVSLTPEAKPKALPTPRPEPTPLKLQRTLRLSVDKLRAARPPSEVMTQARTLDQSVRFVLAEWDDLETSPEHQQNMWNIVEIYLPQVIETYLDAPNLELPAAVEGVVDSLVTLTKASDNIKQAILDNNVRELNSHARMLRSKFGNLPGLNDEPPSGSGYTEEP